MNKTNILVFRIIGIVLTLIVIAQRAYFTFNILKRPDPGILTNVVIYYILEILALVAVVVGFAIGKSLIAQIGFLFYYAVAMVMTIVQSGASGTMIKFTDVLFLFISIVIITMIILVMTKMLNPFIACIVLGAMVLLDVLVYFIQMIMLVGVDPLSLSVIRDAFAILILGVAMVCACIITPKKSSE